MGGVLADQLLALWSTQRSSLPVCRSFLTWLRANGNSLDLDQYVRPEEPAHLDERARRRALRVDVLVTDRPHRGDVAHVGEEVAQLDDVAPGGIRAFESAGQVLEHLPRLGVDVSLADELALSVEGDLARDVDDPLRRRIDHVAVAEGRRHRLRGEKSPLCHAPMLRASRARVRALDCSLGLGRSPGAPALEALDAAAAADGSLPARVGG